MKTKRWRAFWRTMLVVLWLAVLLLALELGTRLLEWWAWRDNPFIAAELEKAPWPVVPARLHAIHLPGKEDQSDLPADPASRAHDAVLLAPDDLTWREAFAGMDALQRDLLARLRQTLVFDLDAQGAVVQSYGPYMARAVVQLLEALPDTLGGDKLGDAPEALQAAIDEVRRSGQLARRTFTLLESVAYPHELEVRPAQENGTTARLFVYADLMWLARQMLPELAEDSLWEIPFLRQKPNLRGALGPMGFGAFDTNEWGLRDDPVLIPKPAGTYRILCIGGSTTVEGDTNESAYPNILERLLQEAFPGVEIDVINCGVAGVRTSDHVTRMRDYLAMEPDLFLVYAGINDLTQSVDFAGNPFVAMLLRERLARMRFIRHWFGGLLLPDDEARNTWIEHFTIRNLQVIAMAADARGAAMAVATVCAPDPEVLTEEEAAYCEFHTQNQWGNPALAFDWYINALNALNRRYENVCAQEGWLLLPVAKHFHAGLDTFSDLCHMRPAGIEAKAQIMAHYLTPFLKQRLSVSPGVEAAQP